MYIKKNQLGRKISAKGAIAFAAREKEKQLKEWRRKNRKRKIRKSDALKAKRLQQALARSIKQSERPTISLKEAHILSNDVKDTLESMGFMDIHITGRVRREMSEISSVPVVVKTYNQPDNSMFDTEFLLGMAERSYIAVKASINFSKKTQVNYLGTPYIYVVDGIFVSIYLTPPETFGTCMIKTTGNDLFWKKLCGIAKKDNMVLKQYGLYVMGEMLPSSSEADVFEQLDMAFVDLPDRSVSKPKRVCKHPLI